MSNPRSASAAAAYERDLKLAIERSKEEARRAAERAEVDEKNVKLAVQESLKGGQARQAHKCYRSSSIFGKRTEKEQEKLSVDEIYNHEIFDSIKI